MRQIQGTPLPLGVTVTQDSVNFSIEVPDGKKCTLVLYHCGEQSAALRMEMPERVGAVHYLALADLTFDKLEYHYEMDGEAIPDPYAKKIAGREEWQKEASLSEHAVRGVIERDRYDWEADKPLELPGNEVVAYSLHVRGFTEDKSSRVKKKGTFEGVIEKLPYLLELGVNQLQLMPIYEFDECVQPCNYWGYGPAYYFAPKSAYSAIGDGVKSFKNLVKACHKAGVEVVLEMPFDGNLSKRMMLECVRYYRMEYHIDGVLLNPTVTPMECLVSDPILKKTKILQHQSNYQNGMRRFLKGDEGMVPEVIRLLRTLPEDTCNYITTHSGFTLNDLVSYDGKHNESNGEQNRDGIDYNYSWNCGVEGTTRKKDVLKLRKRQINNAFLLLLLSQGTPCILAGDECYNSQKGNNNVYCQDNPTGWVNWNRLWRDPELFAFVKQVIRIRKTCHVFTPEREMLGVDRNGCGIPDVSYHGENAWRASTEVSSRQIGVYYSGKANKDQDCFVAYNMHWIEHEFALPALPKGKKWYVIASTDGCLQEPVPVEEQKQVEVKPRTIVVFIGK